MTDPAARGPRGAGLRLHPGEAAFPGGAIDSTDDGPVQAALRETAEEVGIAPHDVEVVKCYKATEGVDMWGALGLLALAIALAV